MQIRFRKYIALISFPLVLSLHPNSASADQSSDSVGVHRDAHGALRDNDMLPDSQSPHHSAASPSGSNYGIKGARDGDIGATQSGPGAAALFTPEGPGNAAAHRAQMSGGLQGAPIVNGRGKNVVIHVPMATHSGDPSYVRVHAGTVSHARHSDTPATPVSTHSESMLKNSGSMQQLHSTSDRVPVHAPADHKANSFVHIPASPNVQTQRITKPLSAAAHRRTGGAAHHTGFIKYADGQTVLFGQDGNHHEK
jgi:hypothetical protein